jgi:hypothetical protein
MPDPTSRRFRLDWHCGRLALQLLAALSLVVAVVVLADRAGRLERQNALLLERLPWTPAAVSAPHPAQRSAVQCRATVWAEGRTRQCRNRTRSPNGLCHIHSGR